MTTAWFQKNVGSEVHESIEDPSMMLVGDAVPDWVRLPESLGSSDVRVLGAAKAPCPMCDTDTHVRHLQLENGLGIAECPTHNFVWYRGKAV